MDYLHAGILTNLRDGVVSICREHYHEISSYLKVSTSFLSRLTQRINERISIKSRRLLHSRPTEEEIAHQAMILCRDYMLVKLRKHKLLSNRDSNGKTKLNNTLSQLHFLQVQDQNSIPRQQTSRTATIMSRTKSLGTDVAPADVSKELIKVTAEFEKCFPYMYEDIADQLQLNFQSPSSIQNVFNAVATNIFSKGITWARIVALFTLTGALVVECVKQGHQSVSNMVVDSLQKFIRKRLAGWIIEQGGWVGLVIHFRQRQSSVTVLRLISLSGLILGLGLIFWLPR